MLTYQKLVKKHKIKEWLIEKYINILVERNISPMDLLNEKKQRGVDSAELAPLLRLLKQSPKETIERVYQAVFLPNLEQRIEDVFTERGITSGKVQVAIDALVTKIVKQNNTIQEKLDFASELQKGTLVDAQAIVNEARKGFVELNSTKYIKSNNPVINDSAFYNWFVSWEPQIDNRAMGGGEIFLILNHPTGRKGKAGKGDVYFEGPDLVVELKKGGADPTAEDKEARKGSGAAFGNKDNFSKGKAVFEKFITDNTQYKSLRDIKTNIGLGAIEGGTTTGATKSTKVAASLSQASLLLKANEVSDSEINGMWNDVCATVMGSDVSVKFNCVKNGLTDPNDFMHTWVANGIDAYAADEGHDTLFYYNPNTLEAISFDNGRTYYNRAKNNSLKIDYDWALDWKQGGYGNWVPRLKVEQYKPVPTVEGVEGFEKIMQGVFLRSLDTGRKAPASGRDLDKRFAKISRTLQDDILNILRDDTGKEGRKFSDFRNFLLAKSKVGGIDLKNKILDKLGK